MYETKPLTNIQKLAQDGGKNHRIFVATVKDLMHSQGFYSNIFRTVNEMDEEQYNRFFSLLNEQNFNDTLDVIFWLEVPF